MSSEKEELTHLAETTRQAVFEWLLDVRYWWGFIVGRSGKYSNIRCNELEFSWYSSWGFRVFIQPSEQSSYYESFINTLSLLPQRVFEYRLPAHEYNQYRIDESLSGPVKEIEYLIRKFFPGIHCLNTWAVCEVVESESCLGKQGSLSWCDEIDGVRICEQCKEFREKPKTFDGFIYLVGNKEEGIYKIGLSRQPKERYKALATKLPFKIEILHQIETNDMKKAESLLHSWMRKKRSHGEWFKLSQSDLDFICNLTTFENNRFIDNLGKAILRYLE